MTFDIEKHKENERIKQGTNGHVCIDVECQRWKKDLDHFVQWRKSIKGEHNERQLHSEINRGMDEYIKKIRKTLRIVRIRYRNNPKQKEMGKGLHRMRDMERDFIINSRP